MRCPCCGTPGVQPLSFLEGLRAQVWKVVTLVAAVSTAIIGQAEMIGEPWRHWVAVTATIASALIAWNIKQHPVKETP